MKDHMKVSLSKVLKPKNSREDSREKYPKAKPYFTNWTKLCIPSPSADYLGIHQNLKYIETGIDNAANKGDLYIV